MNEIVFIRDDWLIKNWSWHSAYRKKCGELARPFSQLFDYTFLKIWNILKVGFIEFASCKRVVALGRGTLGSPITDKRDQGILRTMASLLMVSQ